MLAEQYRIHKSIYDEKVVNNSKSRGSLLNKIRSGINLWYIRIDCNASLSHTDAHLFGQALCITSNRKNIY